MPPTELARTSMPGPEEFFERYVFARQPVVVTDLFEHQDVAAVSTIDDAQRAWGTMPVQVQVEYATAERSAQSGHPEFMTFDDYVALTRSNRSTRLCCTEYDTPARVLSSFRLPSVCTARPPLVESAVEPAVEEEVFGLPRKYGDFDLATNTFIANRGNVAHLHFDGDQRQVLLHQVYGRKRVVLFPPSAAIELCTLDGPPTRPSLSGLSLEDLDLDDKLSLVERIGGYHTVLEPGETIYIPMLMWHHLEYLDDAMSFNIRFGRTRFGRFLSLDHFHRDPYIQNVASEMVGPEPVLESFAPVIEEIKAEYTARSVDMRDKVRQIRACFRGLATRLCPGASPEQLCPPEREEEQIARIVGSTDMEGGLKYADPSLLARTRPVGPISDRQRQILGDLFVTLGYSNEVEHAVLGNRLGKVDVDELTKGEAAQLIAYLNSPGAASHQPMRAHP
jgi:lysine-specific demethylase 8